MRLIIAFLFSITLLPVTAMAGSSTDARSDGGKSITQTSRKGTKCTVFNAQGQIMCTRTFGETNHKAAIAKCVRMKC